MDYDALSDRVYNLITKYGRAVTLSIYSGGTFNPILGSYSSATYTNYSVNMVFLPLIGPFSTSARGFTNKDLTALLEGKVDKIGLLPAKDLLVTPTVQDRVLVDEDIYEIVFPEETKPALTSLVWKLWLHKGA